MSALQPPRRALVVYGSETGNAQDVAEEMGRIAERLRFDTDVAELNAISLVGQWSRRCVQRAAVDAGRNNCYTTRSFSSQSPPRARAICRPTAKSSGKPSEVLGCAQAVCSR